MGLVVGSVPTGWSSPAGATGATTSGALLVSQAGDYIGEGKTYVLPTVTYDAVSLTVSGGWVTFEVRSPTDTFWAGFAAPAGQPLVVDTHANAQGPGPRPAGVPGIDIGGDSGGCDTVFGSFTVYDAACDSSGNVVSFAAQFIQRCEPTGPAIEGSLEYNSSASMPPMLVPSTPTVSSGSARVGVVVGPAQVSWTNVGGPAPVTDIAISGPAADDYFGQTDCIATISFGQSCSLTTDFAPGTIGLRQATIAPVVGGTPVAPVSATGTGTAGYYLATAGAAVGTFGDAGYYGDLSRSVLYEPIVGMATGAGGYGYWLVAADGGIFSFGDAHFYGSTGAIRLNQPIVGMTPSWDGKGYWFVASDGGVFAFGDAPFYGSAASAGVTDVIGMAGTAPPTLQAINDLPALRGGSTPLPRLRPGWHTFGSRG